MFHNLFCLREDIYLSLSLRRFHFMHKNMKCDFMQPIGTQQGHLQFRIVTRYNWIIVEQIYSMNQIFPYFNLCERAALVIHWLEVV